MHPELAIGVLGSVRVAVDGSVVEASGRLARLLAALAVDSPRSVSADVLMDRLWGDDQPPTAKASLQVFIGRLRRMLEPERPEGVAWTALVRDGEGYRLVIDDERFDRRRVDRLVADGTARLPSDPAHALRLLDDALACWRGEPWADVAHEPWMADEMSAVADVRARAEAMRVVALLDLHRPDDAARAARAVVAARPFDEGARDQLMRALYRSGRQHEALLEFERARTLLLEEIGVEPGPELQRTRAAILDHDPRLGSRLRRNHPSGGDTNLVRWATPFVGRRRELDELAGLITGSRLITLTGPGGIGKTRLASEVGWRLLEQFADGVWFVDLDPLGTSGDVAGEVARVLSLSSSESTRPRDVIDLICRFVAERQILLILDNCEHLVAATAAVVSRLVAAGNGVHVLSTSRHELDVVGEHVVPVGPLSLPAPGASYDEVIASPAARLFVLRAGEDRLNLDDPPTLDAVTTIVRALEGMPLALELAASRVQILALPELVEAMADRFSALVSMNATRPERHIALRASFDISYGLLRESERELFERLGLVNGPVTADLFGEPGEADRNDATILLDRLVAFSLVSRVETPGQLGYRLLETTRAYARLRLEEADGIDAALEWFTARVLQFVERSRIALRGSTQREVLAALDANYTAIRDFLERLVASGLSDRARLLAVALAPYWTLRPHRGEGPRIIAALRAELDPSTDPLAVAHLAAAEAECGRGKDNTLERLRPQLNQALDVLAEHGCDAEVGACTAFLVVEAAWRGDVEEIRRVRARSAQAVDRIRDPWYEAVDGFFDAVESGLAGDLAGGLRQLADVRVRFVDIGDRAWAARASYWAALACQMLGDDDGFRANVMTSLELSELAGGCGMDGRISLALAETAIESGDPRGEWMLLRASDVLERQGDPIGVAKCRRELALLALDDGDDARATELFARALPVLAALELPALALGLAQMLPIIRRTRPEQSIEVIVASVRSIEAALAGHSSPDLRRLRVLTRDWPATDATDLDFDADRVLDAAFGTESRHQTAGG